MDDFVDLYPALLDACLECRREDLEWLLAKVGELSETFPIDFMEAVLFDALAIQRLESRSPRLICLPPTAGQRYMLLMWCGLLPVQFGGIHQAIYSACVDELEWKVTKLAGQHVP